ncbi:UNVERIFIED_CONTAM: Zinc finger BED domain-containing protein RICESLEEPER 1 [Sesamum angustifolium]|uniref:Zinc finger BED domain-containing protein RICESLEEPER 1 n=1 Tax=Sesamum angustifolium TaxID=2727405 RepID=A0AAW2LD16_9LAMI
MSQEDDGVRIPNPKMSRTNSQDCGDRILKEMQLKASSKVSRGKEVSPSSSGGSVNINRNENFGADDDDMDCDLDCVPEDDVCGGEQDDIKPRKRKDRKEIASRSVYWDHFDKWLEKQEEHLAISRIRGAIRWNSTYLMLEAATCLKRAFSRYEDLDFGYTNDLSKPPHDGVPVDYDWHRASLLLKFLEHFYKLILSISGSLYVTSNNIYHQICAVDLLLKQWLESDDFELCEMSKRMKQTFDKYWGSIEKMNMVIYYAVILDPRYNLEYIEFSFDTLYEDVTQCLLMKEKVKIGMVELFNTYKGMHESLGSSISS